MIDQACKKLGLLPPEVPPNCGVITIATDSWMHQLDKFGIMGNCPISHLCLPGTHDSATAMLTSTLTDTASPKIRELIDKVQFGAISAACVALPPLAIKIMLKTEETVADTTRNLAVATSKRIEDQLKDGVRALDLRVFYDELDQDFYSVHSVRGENYNSILDQLASFLQSHPGEIVYAWIRAMPHLYFDKDKNVLGRFDSDAVFESFGQLLARKLGKYAVRRSEHPPGSSPFDAGYADLNTRQTGRVILQFDKIDAEQNYKLRGEGSEICYSFAEVSPRHDYDVHPPTSGPYMGWHKWSVSEAQASNIGQSDVKNALNHVLRGWYYVPPWVVAPAVAAVLKAVLPDNNCHFRTMREVAEGRNSQLQDVFAVAVGKEKWISAFFADFYETSRLIELAVGRSVVQLSSES